MMRNSNQPHERALWEAYWLDRTDTNRNAIFEHYWPRLHDVAVAWTRFRYHVVRHSDMEDAVSAVATRILEKAIPGCKPDQLGSVMSYMRRHVQCEIQDYLRAADISRGCRKKIRQLQRARASLGSHLSRRPTRAEIADCLGVPEKQIDTMEAIEKFKVAFVSEIFQSLSIHSMGTKTSLLDATLRAETEALDATLRAETEAAENAMAVRLDWQTIMAALGDQERQFCCLRFVEGYSMRKTAILLKVTRSQATSIQKKIGRILRPKCRQIPDL